MRSIVSGSHFVLRLTSRCEGLTWGIDVRSSTLSRFGLLPPGVALISRILAFLSISLAAPVFAQQVRLPSPGVVPLGESLVAELGCLNCHGGQGAVLERLAAKRAPLLEFVGARRTPESLRALLSSPHDARPGTSMPDMLAGLVGSERVDAIDDLVHYLSSRGGPMSLEPFQATNSMLEEGRQILHEVGCVACHLPEEGLDALFEPLSFETAPETSPAAVAEQDERYVLPGTLPAPVVPFHGLAGQTSVQALSKFLMDPVAVRPSGRMPSMELSKSEARDLAVYLLRGQNVDTGYLESPGLGYTYYEKNFAGGVVDLVGLTPTREGSLYGEFEDLEDAENLLVLKHRGNNFAFEFRGTLLVEEPGTYSFKTESDDGSWIKIDREQVVDNGGFHGVIAAEGNVELSKGAHTFVLTFFQGGGDRQLRASWSGPGFEERPLRGDDFVHRTLPMVPLGAKPFELDAERVARGERSFRELGCVSCHESMKGTAQPLVDCDPSAADACLGDGTRAGTARYAMSAEQRSAIQELIRGLDQLVARTPGEHAQALLANQRCFACHRREEIGGPQPERSDYFFADEAIDLGEEGRIPPLLDRVGSKLQPDWLAKVLQEAGTARPHLLTRMPQFGVEPMETVQAALIAADRLIAPPEPPVYSPEMSQAGRALVGTNGFGCIQCHDFNGYRSLGIRAVDLADVRQRIQYPWFRELLRDPAAMNMNARMPQFWTDGQSPVRDVLEGDIDAQIDAVWTYLGMGGSMHLPVGLNVPDSAYELELEPGDAPRLVGVFMKNVSPRVVAVGNPEQVHYAFDLENSRLAKVWRGRFFNARGTWEGRAGALQLPPTDEVLDLPEGPPFALLGELDLEWPKTEGRQSALQARGRGFDEARRPVFRYSLGDIEIEETPVPGNVDGRAQLVRHFKLKSPIQHANLYFQSADGRRAVVFESDPTGGFRAAFEERLTW